MKNKRFIAKCLTLAMVLALMIPTPVSAASSKGKLLKSVTYYEYHGGKWQKENKTSYTYNKKDYPKEIKEISYSNHFMGIPMNASQDVYKTKYKFKGKTPKSMKLKNTAGVVIGTYKYKKGNIVSYSGTDKRSIEKWSKDYETITGYDTIITTRKSTLAYTKKGLPKSGSYSSNTTYSNGTAPRSSSETTTYTVTQKKGIPSQIIVSILEQGDTTPDLSYVKFNKKGLAIEGGDVYVNSTTGAKTFSRNWRMAYKSKKGKVTQATRYRTVAWDDNDNATKEKPDEMYKFKYTKTKASKSRYFKMINDVTGSASYFNWY